jgi:hypothetical protein
VQHIDHAAPVKAAAAPDRPARSGSSSKLELNPNLPLIAPHDPAAASQQQGKLIGNALLIRHRELCAAGGDVPDDAAEERRGVLAIDLRKIVNFVSWAAPQLAERTSRPKKTHLVLLTLAARVNNHGNNP